MTDELLIEQHDGIQVMTLNRPAARNAMSLSLARALANAIDELEQRDDLHVGIITGAGGSFCAGMDLKGFLRGERPSIPGRGFGGLTESPPIKPLIAAIEGYALAGGFELALACDLIVASSDAKFGLPEVKRGLVPSAGGLLRLPSRIPPFIATEYILTGDIMSAQTAHQHGLINRLVDPGQALTAATTLAGTISRNGPLALAACKQILRDMADWPQTEMFARQQEIAAPVFASEDAREGATAFAEKRPPRWQRR